MFIFSLTKMNALRRKLPVPTAVRRFPDPRSTLTSHLVLLHPSPAHTLHSAARGSVGEKPSSDLTLTLAYTSLSKDSSPFNPQELTRSSRRTLCYDNGWKTWRRLQLPLNVTWLLHRPPLGHGSDPQARHNRHCRPLRLPFLRDKNAGEVGHSPLSTASCPISPKTCNPPETRTVCKALLTPIIQLFRQSPSLLHSNLSRRIPCTSSKPSLLRAISHSTRFFRPKHIQTQTDTALLLRLLISILRSKARYLRCTVPLSPSKGR